MGSVNCCSENRHEHKIGIKEKDDDLTDCNINDQARYINTDEIVESKVYSNYNRKKPNIELKITKK